jgi:hypothetical protein
MIFASFGPVMVHPCFHGLRGALRCHTLILLAWTFCTVDEQIRQRAFTLAPKHSAPLTPSCRD